VDASDICLSSFSEEEILALMLQCHNHDTAVMEGEDGRPL
jgi:hypothetical protein